MKRFEITIYGNDQEISFCQLALDFTNARMVAFFVAKEVYRMNNPLVSTKQII
jgi:hypothetical protein